MLENQVPHSDGCSMRRVATHLHLDKYQSFTVPSEFWY